MTKRMTPSIRRWRADFSTTRRSDNSRSQTQATALWTNLSSGWESRENRERSAPSALEFEICRKIPARGIKWGASVARRPPSRAYLLGSEGHFIIVGTCTNSPITADTIPSKRTAFTRPSILFRPHRYPPEAALGRARRACGGGAGYRPRVRSAYYAAVYCRSWLPSGPYIGLER